MDEPEILAGGGVNEVIRVGATVRRPAGAWTPLVHQLLRHLRAAGFTAAPAPHGITADGLEILDFLPGDVAHYPLPAAARTPEALVSAGEMLRAYHDATVDFAGTGPRAGWQLPAVEPVEVLCHGDYAPYNCVLDGSRVVGLIDFDVAHPGSRLWDVAYGAYRWVLTGEEDTGDDQVERLRIFVDAYGLDAHGRRGLISMVARRLAAMVAFMQAQAAAGSAAFAGHLAEGHHLLYRADSARLLARRAEVERRLLQGITG